MSTEETKLGTKIKRDPVEVDLVTYACPRCGKKFEREEEVTLESNESLKLYGTIAFGVVFLLGIWFWVFQFGVPFVRSINKG